MSFINIEFKEIVIKYILQSLNFTNKKYDNGICGFFGSSSIFTGGIYFAAISAMHCGTDQSHIFAHSDSVQALKCYSPDIIVHNSYSNIIDKMKLTNDLAFMNRLSTITFGTCLGREDYVVELLNIAIVESLKCKSLHSVLDADSLYFLSSNKNFSNNIIETMRSKELGFILTPNSTEFNHLTKLIPNLIANEDDYYDKMNIEHYKANRSIMKFDKLDNLKKNDLYYKEVMLSRHLNQIIFKKGLIDIITDGNSLLLVSNRSSIKRCGGIGDILTGVISAFISMSKKFIGSSEDILLILSCAGYYTREITNKAFTSRGMSMIASDVINEMRQYPIDKIVDYEYNL